MDGHLYCQTGKTGPQFQFMIKKNEIIGNEASVMEQYILSFMFLLNRSNNSSQRLIDAVCQSHLWARLDIVVENMVKTTK